MAYHSLPALFPTLSKAPSSTMLRTQSREPLPATAWNTPSSLKRPDLNSGEKDCPQTGFVALLVFKEPVHSIHRSALSGLGEKARQQRPCSQHHHRIRASRQGPWNDHIKNNCDNKVLSAIWSNGLLSRASH